MRINPCAILWHVYEVRPRRDHRGVDLISDVLPFKRLCYGEPNAVAHAIECASILRGVQIDSVIRVSNYAGDVIVDVSRLFTALRFCEAKTYAKIR